MEESGHYYTVYYASLAVGFTEGLAFQHALLAQMPDEVGWLDAANMHTKEALRFVFAPLAPSLYTEHDLRGNLSYVPTGWRYRIEYALHALVDHKLSDYTKSSKFQQTATRDLLMRYNADSLEFGLLLHRLGDTYAHAVMGEEHRMYTTTSSGVESFDFRLPSNMGHFVKMHDPDYWFNRSENLFFSYLKSLYGVLNSKVKETQSAPRARRSYEEMEASFRQIIRNVVPTPKFPSPSLLRSPTKALASYAAGALAKSLIADGNLAMAIREIKREMMSLPDVPNMREYLQHYKPEQSSGKQLAEFLRETRHTINGRQIDGDDIENAMLNIFRGLQENDGEALERHRLQHMPGNTNVNVQDIFNRPFT